MRIQQSYVQKCKVLAHVFQAILVFVATCLTIAVMVKDGETGGATKYFLVLVCRRSLACDARQQADT